MSFAHGLYQRFQVLIQEAASFGVVGAIGFVVTLGGADLLHVGAGLGPTTAEVIATVVATCVSYLGNRYWSFRRRTRTNVPREALIFFFLNGVGIVIQTVCVDFTYYILGLHANLVYNISLIFGIGLGTMFRWWSYRKWVWAAPQAGSESGPVPAVPGGVPAGATTAGSAAPWDKAFTDASFDGAPGNGTPGSGSHRDGATGNGAVAGNGAVGDGTGAGGAAPSGDRWSAGPRAGGQDLQPANGSARRRERPWGNAPSLEK